MSKIHVLYEGDLHTLATHVDTGQTLHTDAPKDNQGQGQTFSPTDLLATSLATCIATIMGMYARNHGIDLRGMEVRIEKVMSTTAPRRVAKLLIDVIFPEGLSQEERERLLKAGQSCPVHHSLHPSIEIVVHSSTKQL